MRRTLLLISLLFLCISSWAGPLVNVPVTSIALNETNLQLKQYGYTNLIATVLPVEASDKEVIWKSSLPGHISVDQHGYVQVNYEGAAVITATTKDGGFVATCNITCQIDDAANINMVNTDAKQNISISDKKGSVLMYTTYGTDISNLTTTFIVSPGASISPDPATISDYTKPAIFTVTAKDGVTKKQWTVSIKNLPDLSAAETYTLKLDSATAPTNWMDSPTTWYDNNIRLSIVSAYKDGTPSSQINGGILGLYPASLIIDTKNAGKKIIAVEFNLGEYCGEGCTYAIFYPDNNTVPLPTGGESTPFLVAGTPADSLQLTSSESMFSNIKLWFTDSGEITQHTPTANAGKNQTVETGDTVWLDGTASVDIDGDSLSYVWQAKDIELINIINPTSATPYFIAPKFEKDLQYDIVLTVKDSASTSRPSTVTIKVLYVNHAPVAKAGNDTTVFKGDYITLDASKSYDIDGDKIGYEWIVPLGIDVFDYEQANIGFNIPMENTESSYTFILQVYDADTTVNDTITLHIDFTNRKPIADAGTLGYPIMTTEGNETYLYGHYSNDPDGDSLYFSWTSSSIIELTELKKMETSFTTPNVKKDTTVFVYLTVFDGLLYSETDTITIDIKNINEGPIAAIVTDDSTLVPTIYCTENQEFTVDGTASSDPENDKLSYKWILPSELSVTNDTLSIIKIMAPDMKATTSYDASLTVSDGALESTLKFKIKVKDINLTPFAITNADLTIIEGDTAFLDGSASYDPEKVTLTYHWSCLTELSSTTSIDPWFRTPEVTKDSIIKVSLTVSDGVNVSISDTMRVLVKNKNKAPQTIFTPNTDRFTGFVAGENETQTIEVISAVDPDGDDLTYSWNIPELFQATNLNSATPTIITPEVKANTAYNAIVTISDGELNAIVHLTILVEQINKAPISDAGVDKNAMSYETVTLDGSASYDLDENSLTYSWKAPEGITLNNSSVAKPSFTCPNVSEITEYQFILSVSDKLLFARDTVIVTCYPKQALVSLTVEVNEQLISANFFKLIMYQLVDNSWISSFPQPFKVSNDSCYYLISEGEWMLSVASATPEFNFIATYFGNTSNWADANTIKVTNDQINRINIACIIPKVIETGTGVISGIIYNYTNILKSVTLLEQASTNPSNPPAAGVNILLYSKTDSSLLGSTLTNTDGQFTFANLPLGSYYLEVQLPGYEGVEAFNVDITTEAQSKTEINFAIDTVNHTITDTDISKKTLLTIYPNPFTDYLFVDIDNLTSSTIIARVLDLYGKTVVTLPINTNNNKIELSSLPEGVYILQISSGKQLISTTKIIKQ